MSQSYTLFRSARRKTLSIQVRDGEVLVRAPVRASQTAIEAFVRSRADWVRRHQRRQQHEIETLGVRLEQGGVVPWQGEMQQLNWQRGITSAVEQGLGGFLVTLSHRVRRPAEDVVAEYLKGWFVQQAGVLLTERARDLSARTGLQPAAITIGNWRGRWGQCSSRGEVQLNWRLLQLTPVFQDYVILHELCHLRHMNHGPEFHGLLQRHCPAHPRLHREIQQYTPWLKW